MARISQLFNFLSLKNTAGAHLAGILSSER
jgi:hypothetical protein